jgi:tRNA threonylcarbamoyladenosine biosynthesis protein TsaB
MITLMKPSYQPVNILAFDTSGDVASVAVWADEKIRKASLPFGTGSHSQASQLFSVMQGLLSDANITFQDLNIIATLVGPGSFTGIRSGLAAAQGLILSTKATSFAPTTLQNYAFGAWQEKEGCETVDSYLVTLSTKRDSFYTQAFDKTLEALFPASIKTEDEINEILAMNPRMCRVENLSLLSAETVIYFYFHIMETAKNPPCALRPYYVHDPEFVKQKSWSL